VTSFSCLPGYSKNVKARSPSTMDLRKLRTATAEEDFKSMANNLDDT
jgi:hypothetical protein